jgi:ATP adenylyltransferase/5',5'''-P-1,P-4-tetraphosphate phosphorylase II
MTMLAEIEELFEKQIRAWPQLAKGVQGLARATTRQVRIDWFDIFIRHIPHRWANTTAAVDQASVAKRPCFLCAENLPAEEEGAAFNNDFTVYCNPFPIVDHHLTIAHRDHRSQRIANQFGNMLDLAAALPGYFIIYNGPECGASAPDHMHFQAGSRRLFPIEKDTAGLTCLMVPGYARNVFIFNERDRSALINRMDRVLELLAQATGERAEPLINAAVFYERDEWFTYLFPRGKHRPNAFHTGELMVSPASIDLCGIFVVPRARDFEIITGDAVAAVFREVTLPDDCFREIADKLERER